MLQLSYYEIIPGLELKKKKRKRVKEKESIEEKRNEKLRRSGDKLEIEAQTSSHKVQAVTKTICKSNGLKLHLIAVVF